MVIRKNVRPCKATFDGIHVHVHLHVHHMSTSDKHVFFDLPKRKIIIDWFFTCLVSGLTLINKVRQRPITPRYPTQGIQRDVLTVSHRGGKSICLFSIIKRKRYMHHLPSGILAPKNYPHAAAAVSSPAENLCAPAAVVCV